jgi:hypothetical protein
MQSVRPENREPVADQRFREQPEHDDAIREDCALSFQDRLNLSDDDAGSDPYNRTGRFRRNVR